MILPGAEECNAEGMAYYMGSHRREIDRERTFFVNLDSVSYGDVHFQRSEGAIVNRAMDRRLVELCEAIAEAQRTEEGDEAGHAARPIRHSFHTDALPAVVRGFRAISIVGASDGVGPPYYHTPEDTPDKVDAESLSRAVEFTLDLVRAIDRDIGRTEADGDAPRSRRRALRASGISRRRGRRRGARPGRAALGALGRDGRALPHDRVPALARRRARPRASTTTARSGSGR